jgi:hypothetical protein
MLSLGIGIAAIAFYVLLGWPSGPDPLDEIDVESRDQLERVLERTGSDEK